MEGTSFISRMFCENLEEIRFVDSIGSPESRGATPPPERGLAQITASEQQLDSSGERQSEKQ